MAKKITHFNKMTKWAFETFTKMIFYLILEYITLTLMFS